MAAGKYNFKIEQGATTNFEIQWTDSSGDPIDLTHYDHARMKIKESDTSTSVIITLSSSIEGLGMGKGLPYDLDGTGLSLSGSDRTTPLTSGSIGVFISAASSSAFSFNEAFYDLEVVSGSDFPVVTRLLEGKVKLSKEITTT